MKPSPLGCAPRFGSSQTGLLLMHTHYCAVVPGTSHAVHVCACGASWMLRETLPVTVEWERAVGHVLAWREVNGAVEVDVVITDPDVLRKVRGPADGYSIRP